MTIDEGQHAGAVGARGADATLEFPPLRVLPGERSPVEEWLCPAERFADWSDEDRTTYSTMGFADAAPDLCARPVPGRRLGRRRAVAAAVALLLVVALVLAPVATLTVAVALITLAYTAVLVQRLLLMRRAATSSVTIQVTDDDARAFPASQLPTYTVLVPAYKEPGIVARVLEFLDELDYPRDKLDVKLLLEADDEATIAAAAAVSVGEHLSIVLVPASEPRTKPKACNFGLTSARGELLTIFDAEDRPEPLQLRRAAVAFRREPKETACLQARLSYHNSEQNVITRWFTNEYDTWFTWLLPGLVSSGAPIPLGGTSNHLRTKVLLGVGGWDPFNVTEDADLGVRLARFGYSVGVLDSVTYEEANSDFVNWVKQRSRWYKGYLQTWLVHMRHPVRLTREIGLKSVLGFTLFVAGTPLLAALNPVFWGLSALWWLAKPMLITQLFPAPLYHLGMACWIIGGFGLVYGSITNARATGRPELIGSLLLLPLYWAMMSLAAVKAVYQLVFQPSYWEKTTHGLDVASPPVSSAPVAPAGAAS